MNTCCQLNGLDQTKWSTREACSKMIPSKMICYSYFKIGWFIQSSCGTQEWVQKNKEIQSNFPQCVSFVDTNTTFWKSEAIKDLTFSKKYHQTSLLEEKVYNDKRFVL